MNSQPLKQEDNVEHWFDVSIIFIEVQYFHDFMDALLFLKWYLSLKMPRVEHEFSAIKTGI